MDTKATNATSRDLGQLDQWNQIYSLFKGSKPQTATRTTQTQLSPDATQAMLQQIMESQQGLANTAAGQKGKGLYKSSTNQMLTNKLMSDTAAKVSLASAPTTVTETVSGGNQGGIDKGMLGAYAGMKFLTSDTGKKLGKSAMDYLFGGADESPAASVIPSFSTSQMLSDFVGGGQSVGTGWYDGAAGAASSAAGAAMDWIGSLFRWADGGRVPVQRAWADGGRVAGLRGAKTGVLPTIKSLNQYSGAQTSRGSAADAGASSVGTGPDDAADGEMSASTLDEMRGAWDTPGANLTRELADLLGVETSTMAKGTSFAGKTAAGALASMVAGPTLGASLFGAGMGMGLGPQAAGYVAGTATGQVSSLARGLVDDSEMMTMKANETRRAEADMPTLGTWWSMADPSQLAASQSRAMEVDPQVMAEQEAAAALEALQSGTYGSSGGDTSMGSGAGYGESTRPGGVGFDEVGNEDYGDAFGPSEESSADQYGPEGGGNFGSSDSDEGWAQGGRVKGDKNYGNDDVPIKMSPKAGGGIGFLDGGEHVLKATTVKKLDGALGRQFLDELNKNPDKLISFILNGKE